MSLAPQIKQQPAPVYPTRTEVISKEDTAAIVAQQQKKRQGYQSTIATSGGGLSNATDATIKKVALGT